MIAGEEFRRAIRGIIKHRQTEQFYLGEGQWTPALDLAMEFKTLSALVEEARKYNIKDCCEFIVRFEDQPEFSIMLPL